MRGEDSCSVKAFCIRQTPQLCGVLRHSLADNRHLLLAQAIVSLVEFCERTQDFGIECRKSDIVVVRCRSRRLFVRSLHGINCHHSRNLPIGIGHQHFAKCRDSREIELSECRILNFHGNCHERRISDPS